MTLSVHWVLAIIERLALLRMCLTAINMCGSRSNGESDIVRSSTHPFRLQWRAALLCIAMANVPWRFPLPIYLVQSDDRLTIVMQFT